LSDFEAALHDRRIFCFSARARIPYTHVHYERGDCLLFGGESQGLPEPVVQRYGDRAVLIPMAAGKVRSLNLATAVGIALYEGLRQLSQWGPAP
jgi:tRNA (cytidine/uridine-2'-O-)-methyltransferase